MPTLNPFWRMWISQAHKVLTETSVIPPSSPQIQVKVKEMFGVEVGEREIRRIMNELNLSRCPKGQTTKFLKARGWESEVQAMIDSIAPNLNQPIYLTGDWTISSDWHTPCVSMKWYNILREKSIEHRIKKLAILGDLINFDILSHYWANAPDPTTPTIEQELEIVKRLLDKLEEQFNEIVWVLGNHEKARIIKVLNKSIGATELLGLLERSKNPKYRVSFLSYCYLDNIRLTHPKSYRQTKLSVASELATKHCCPVLQAHGHFFGLSFSKGGYLIGDTGGLMDSERIQYLMSADTTFPQLNNGFFIYKNKKIIPYGEGIGL